MSSTALEKDANDEKKKTAKSGKRNEYTNHSEEYIGSLLEMVEPNGNNN